MANFRKCHCFGRPEPEADKEQRKLSRKIDKDIKKEKKKTVIKLLLLGTGEAGKSTFVKQMKILHGKGYDENEKMEFIQEIYSNMIDGIQKTLQAMKDLSIQFEGDLDSVAEEVAMMDPYGHNHISEQVITSLTLLWKDPGLQKCFSRRSEYQVQLCTQTFMDDIERLTAPGYVPSEQDLLFARKRTTGIVEHQFTLDTDNKKGGVIFKLIDVGGQRSERKKWIQCFDTVKVVIFLAAISEYDEVLWEDLKTNRLLEAKRLFRTVLEMPWFIQAAFILFLNKRDIFEEKIKTRPLNRSFPGFTGPEGDVDAAEEFIKRLFLDCAESMVTARTVVPYATVATNPKNIDVIFKSVKIIIYQMIFNEMPAF